MTAKLHPLRLGADTQLNASFPVECTLYKFLKSRSVRGPAHLHLNTVQNNAELPTVPILQCSHNGPLRCCVHAALYLLLGRVMLPPEEGWALFLLWVCAHVGGFVASKVNLPPLLGMLIAGIILRNIPQGHTHTHSCSHKRPLNSCTC